MTRWGCAPPVWKTRPLVAVTAAVASLAVPAVTAPAAEAVVSPLGRSVRATGPLQTGALFPKDSNNHTCSGTVTSAGGEPVVVTAAHCVFGSAAGWTFAPAYRNGARPAGTWTVEAAYVDPRWNAGRNQAYDVAVLRIAHKRIAGIDRDIGYLTGAVRLGTLPADGTVVDIAGYQWGQGDTAVSCSNRTSRRYGYGFTSCSYLPVGVSGSGMRFGPRANYLGGVIGGYHQGGCRVSDAYTSPFGSWTAALVQRANARRPGDAVPYPIGDGCVPGRP